MRLWSVHPKFLDNKGLGANWAEGLQGIKALQGKTKMHVNHPQLNRFKAMEYPAENLAAYLVGVWAEANGRGLNYNFGLLTPYLVTSRSNMFQYCPVTSGQIEYEWKLLLSKLKNRSLEKYEEIKDLEPSVHKFFYVIEGEIEDWEKVKEIE